MEKPKKPFPPMKYEYDAKVERKYIYSCWESLREEDEDWDEDEDEGDDDDVVPQRGGFYARRSEMKSRAKKCKPIGEVDLAWLLTQLPEGIKPNQIKIEFGYNASSMAYEDHYVRFYYEAEIPARKAEYNAALKKHQEDLEQYDKDLVVYEEACREQEIRETEAKLARLKGK